jgi:hypothetical protein
VNVQDYDAMTQYQFPAMDLRAEVRKYGCTIEMLQQEVDRRLMQYPSAAMMVVSMLAEAQELTARDVGGQFDIAIIEDQRQLLNRARWILENYSRP